jgi:hypothetical protein
MTSLSKIPIPVLRESTRSHLRQTPTAPGESGRVTHCDRKFIESQSFKDASTQSIFQPYSRSSLVSMKVPKRAYSIPSDFPLKDALALQALDTKKDE